jgi:flagellar hook protein FlgE
MTMNGVMSVAVQAINAQSKAIGNISNNVANATTPGYKTVETQFLDVLQGLQATSSPVLGNTKSMGVVAYADFDNRSQGQIVADSDNPASAAISGNGFFPVAKAASVDPQTGEVTLFETTTYYTRQGDFHLDSSGRLVNSAGYYLMASPSASGTTPSLVSINTAANSAGGAFSSVSITDGGAINVHYDDGSSTLQGQIVLANFQEPDSLDRIDGTAFVPTEASGNAVYGNPMTGGGNSGVGTIKGSAREESTVDTADQMTKLIVAQQAYSMNSQVIQAANDMMTTALDMKD